MHEFSWQPSALNIYIRSTGDMTDRGVRGGATLDSRYETGSWRRRLRFAFLPYLVLESRSNCTHHCAIHGFLRRDKYLAGVLCAFLWPATRCCCAVNLLGGRKLHSWKFNFILLKYHFFIFSNSYNICNFTIWISMIKIPSNSQHKLQDLAKRRGNFLTNERKIGYSIRKNYIC